MTQSTMKRSTFSVFLHSAWFLLPPLSQCIRIFCPAQLAVESRTCCGFANTHDLILECDKEYDYLSALTFFFHMLMQAVKRTPGQTITQPVWKSKSKAAMSLTYYVIRSIVHFRQPRHCLVTSLPPSDVTSNNRSSVWSLERAR